MPWQTLGVEQDADEVGEDFLRPTKVIGTRVRAHWWYYPDSYDIWLPAAHFANSADDGDERARGNEGDAEAEAEAETEADAGADGGAGNAAAAAAAVAAATVAAAASTARCGQ